MASEPIGNTDVVNCALPPLSCTVPNNVFPIVNVIGPVGTTVGDEIVAVKVTASPIAEGLVDEVIVAALVVCWTT